MDYRSAGVNIDKADALVDNVKEFARSTYNKSVLGGVGGFGALYELGKYKEPVMVSSTDGIGTKILIAHQMEKYYGLGYDLVAMCVDDIICSGGKPLFFLDYIAVGKLKEGVYLKLIESISKACAFAECALIGGETAELPGMYPEDEFDVAGFSVGVVEKSEILDPQNVEKGDAVIALASSGFHSNGYSLVRKIVADKKLDLHRDYGFGVLGSALLTPTEIYSPVLVKAVHKFKKAVKGIAHITGGGIEGNLCRVIPETLDAQVKKGTWKIPDVIRFIVEEGGLTEAEAYKVFNMGVGMALVVSHDKKDEIIDFFNKNSYKAYLIGEMVKGSGEVRLM